MDKVKIKYWVECITANGIESFSTDEEIPVEALIAMGTSLQTLMIDDTLNFLANDAVAIIDSGVDCYVSKDEESSLEPSEEDFEPRLKHITTFYGEF